MEIPIHQVNFLALGAGNMSASSVTSTSLNLDGVRHVSVQAVWTGTSPVGSFTVEASNDDTNYSVLDTLSISSNSGSKMYNYSDVGYRYIRGAYARTSGIGTLSVRINGKL